MKAEKKNIQINTIVEYRSTKERQTDKEGERGGGKIETEREREREREQDG